MTGVEKGLAGVVAPLGMVLIELPWRSCWRRWPEVDPRGWDEGRAGGPSLSFEPEGSKKKGRGGRSGPPGVSPDDCAEDFDDDEDMTSKTRKGAARGRGS